MGSAYLHSLICPRPKYERSQQGTLSWLSQAYKAYQKEQTYSESDYEKLLRRVGVSSEQISTRGYYLGDFELPPKSGDIFGSEIQGASARNQVFSEITNEVFRNVYENRKLPEHLIHVSCTGYRSPSAAQLIAAQKSPDTVVTHSYHMGCYGAFPALRMAKAFLESDTHRSSLEVDVVHTELCALQFQPEDPSLEQILIQTLFADGVSVYRVSRDRPTAGFEILSQAEFLIPDSDHAMSWSNSDSGFRMSLSKDVPQLIATHLRDAMEKWEKQDLRFQRAMFRETLCAVHPGGPKIIDFARDTLELGEDQVRHSRKVLHDFGNMSSATVPHIWKEILEDESVVSGTPVISMAFGPGLTLCLCLLKVIK